MAGLIPWGWGRRQVPIHRETELSPFQTLRQEMDRLFDEFLRGFEVGWPSAEEPFGYTFPRIDMSETDKEVLITAELPGLTEKDIELSLSRDMLTISGEKKEEKEESVKGYYRMERHYGAFRRQLPLPVEVDPDRCDASFKNGILTVKLAKTPEAQKQVKSIPIKKA